MKKIISLFQRNYETDRLVRNEIVPGAEWVVNGEGVATRKWNGTACMVKDGKLYKRYDAKHGKKPPMNFIPAQEPDPVSGHWPGWVPVGNEPESKWHVVAFNNYERLLCEITEANITKVPDGTYEAIGPHFQANAECREEDTFEPHGKCILYVPRDYERLKLFFQNRVSPSLEGIVWHHPDGRMVKIKAKDFGVK